MIKYYLKVGRKAFKLAPDGNPSGGTGNPGAGQGGHQGQQGAPAPNADPFQGIDFDDLPPQVKEQLTKAKEQFATLQTQTTQSNAQLEAAQRQAREFQSRHDKLAADLQRLNGGNPQQQQGQNPQEILLGQVEQVLINRGVSPENAKLQAPIHAELLGIQAEAIKKEMGLGLQPVVGAVLQQQAQGAWQTAQSQDRLGALQIPEVAQATWEGVQYLVSQGQPVTPEAVINLRNMHYASHIEQNGNQPPQFQPGNPTLNQPPMFQPPQQPQFPQIATRFSYPGAGNFVPPSNQQDPNAPKHALNEDTRAALAATFSRMGSVQPKAFQNQQSRR